MIAPKIRVLTGAQVRAARAMLRWSAEDLATRSRLGVATIRRIESNDGPLKSTLANVEAIYNAFDLAGIEFIGETYLSVGVKFK